MQCGAGCSKACIYVIVHVARRSLDIVNVAYILELKGVKGAYQVGTKALFAI